MEGDLETPYVVGLLSWPQALPKLALEINTKKVATLTERCNTLLALVPTDQYDLTSDSTKTQHNLAKFALDDVYETFASGLEEELGVAYGVAVGVLKQTAKMLLQDLPGMRADGRWYEGGNMLDELEKHAEVIKHTTGLFGPNSDLYNRSRDRAAKSEDQIVANIFATLLTIPSMPGSAFAMFHSCVWMKARFLVPDTESLLGQERLGSSTRLLDHVVMQILQSVGTASIPELTPLGQRWPAWLNCVGALNVLIDEGWQSKTLQCEEDDGVFFDDARGIKVGPCWHEHNEGILELLMQHPAYEIRDIAMLAIGSHLPVELVDVVAEWLMVAEGVLPLTDVFDEQGRMKEEYRCTALDEEDEDDE